MAQQRPAATAAVVAVCIALVCGGGMAAARQQAGNAVPVRPDIVMILADDLSLGAMDAAVNVTLDDGSRLMPNFRRYILDKAVEFRQALSPNALCCPARATLLTGQYSHNHGSLSNNPRNGGILHLRDGSDWDNDGPPDGDTVALALQRAGYRTAYVGKYLNGYAMSLQLRDGPARRAFEQHYIDRYGAKASLIVPVMPDTGRTYEPPGWTEWYGSLDLTTYCTHNTVFSVDGRPTLFHSGGLQLDPEHLPAPLPPGGALNYQTDVVRDLSLRFLAQHGSSPDPLFLSINALAPHVEFCDWAYDRLNDVGPVAAGERAPFVGNIDPLDKGGQGYRAHFLDSVRPAPGDRRHLERLRNVAGVYLAGFPSFDETDVSDKPSFIRGKTTPMLPPYLDAPSGTPGDRYPHFVDPRLFPVPPAQFNRDISVTNPREQATDQFAHMVASMAAVDRLIGAVAARLEAQGRLSNTVFVFTSDNGYSHGQHRLNGKLLVYEESIRVPFYVALPRLTGGPQRSRAMVLHTDVAPTLLDLASTSDRPARLQHVPDGTSLKALLQYPGLPWRKQALIEHFSSMWPDEPLSLPEHPTLFAVRTSVHNSVAPSRLYAEYFSGMQYAAANGPLGWPAGFYRRTCRPDFEGDVPTCPPGTLDVPVRPFIYIPGPNPDRLADREYYNLELDPFEISNAFAAASPEAIRNAAAAETPTLTCRLDALVACAGRGCQAAEWAADCP